MRTAYATHVFCDKFYTGADLIRRPTCGIRATITPDASDQSSAPLALWRFNPLAPVKFQPVAHDLIAEFSGDFGL
jgi:hypothetical protein